MKDLSTFASLRSIGLASVIMVLICLVLFFSCDLAAVSSSRTHVGGACIYKQYSGEAEIISVTQRKGTSSEYEVRFSFHTNETIQEEFALDEGKQRLIVQQDFSYPHENFLKQYDITTGKRLPCYMKVITKGTCTPVLFDFPTIRNGRAQ